MRNYDAIIIGGGSAGLAAAIEINNQGFSDILLIERDVELGGILLQCIHNGFGLKIFKEELTGPEYAEKFVNELHEKGIKYKLDSVVTKVNEDKTVEYVNQNEGYITVSGNAIVLTMGCYERNAGAISIPGSRPAGILTAGTAQKYLNIDGYLVGKKVFILGSGDIGLIMARRMTLEGAEVLGVADLQPFSGGLQRNIVQCLEDYNIPLYLSHTVTKVIGKTNIEKIILQEVDNFIPIAGTEKEFEVDTLLLSIGLIPENDISEKAGIIISNKTKGPVVDESYQTNIAGVFACGNALHVHDLVDFVTEESRRAGKSVGSYLKKELKISDSKIKLEAEEGISYIVPQHINIENIESKLEVFLRVKKEFKNVSLNVYSDGTLLKSIKKKHMAPAEMEKLHIKKEILVNVSSDIVIKVEDQT